MSYDFEDDSDKSPPKHVVTTSMSADDLEAIVMLLEIATIFLTSQPGVTFTFDELFAQAKLFADDLILNEVDVRLVFDRVKFLQKEPNGRFSLK